MEYGIQRRTVYLTPPIGDDLAWFFDLFDRTEIWELFGFDGPARQRTLKLHAEGNMVLGIARRVRDQKRIGFGVLFPPSPAFSGWEPALAIPDLDDRDAFSAMAINDILSHYAFEHLGLLNGRFRVRSDNRTCEVLVRRMGYRPHEIGKINGHEYKFFRVRPEIWQKRRERIEAGDARNPSGHGGPFAILADPPYDPIPLSFEGCQAAEDSPAPERGERRDGRELLHCAAGTLVVPPI
jgi:hypothetical protein